MVTTTSHTEVWLAAGLRTRWRAERIRCDRAIGTRGQGDGRQTRRPPPGLRRLGHGGPEFAETLGLGTQVPTSPLPRKLADIDLWEIHEAFTG